MVKQFLKFASQRRQQWRLEHIKPEDQNKSEKTTEDRKEPVVTSTKDPKQ